MNQSGRARGIRWRGSLYDVAYHVIDGVVSVRVDPENSELEQAARQSIQLDQSKALSVYVGFDFNYLTCDPQRGE